MSFPTQPSLEENVGHTPYKSNAGLEPRHTGLGPHLGMAFSSLIVCTNQDVICLKKCIIAAALVQSMVENLQFQGRSEKGEDKQDRGSFKPYICLWGTLQEPK